MSDALLFTTITGAHWGAVIAKHRNRTLAERNDVSSQLVLLLAIQRAHNDGFRFFAAALKKEYLRLYGDKGQQLSRRGLCVTSGLGDTGSATPAGAGVALADFSKQSLYNREPSVTNRPTTAPSAGAKVETVTPVMPGKILSLPLYGGDEPAAA